MDLHALRNALSNYITSQPWGTHDGITEGFARLGLPEPQLESGVQSTKQRRVDGAAEELLDEELVTIAEAILAREHLFPATRFRIEEILWQDWPGIPAITKRVRHELANSLDIEQLFQDWDAFLALLDRLWVLDDPNTLTFGAIFFNEPVAGLRRDVAQHVGRNQDWTTRELFERLGAFTCTTRRFALFLNGLAGSDVLPDETSQRRFAATVNDHLTPVGVTFAELSSEDGYPRFALSATGAETRRPKNIIFASRSKPDLRFRSAMDNDIEILNHRDEVLVYTRQLVTAGLTWSDLQTWWEAEHDLHGDAAKTALWNRLLKALPDNSPPQRRFFRAYHDVFKNDIGRLPALLPEVWYCWDPRTVEQRGQEALLRFRMDFLMLLPGPRRVVIEVDGKTHYTDSYGRADPKVYARTVAADRELRLSGYDVYRFGAAELDSEKHANEHAKQFFSALFQRHGISPHA